MPVGRSTKYTPELLKAAWAYIDGGWEKAGDPVPTVVGLALEIGIDKETAYRWAKEEGKEEFSNILTRVSVMQERKLVAGGLANLFNPAITKMMLTKHGYSDKIEQNHTSNDGSMSPKPHVIEFVAPQVNDESDDTGNT